MLNGKKWKLKAFALGLVLIVGGFYWKILYTGPLYEAKQALVRLQKTPIFSAGGEPATTRKYTLRSAHDRTERERLDWGPYRARLVRDYVVNAPLSTLAELLIDWNPLASRSGFTLVEACGWTEESSSSMPSHVHLKYRRGKRSPFDFLTVTMEKGQGRRVVVHGYQNTEERNEKRPPTRTPAEVARIRGGAEPKCDWAKSYEYAN